MLIFNDEQRLRAGIKSLSKRCSYCSKALSEYPLIMNDDAGLAVFHAACAAALATIQTIESEGLVQRAKTLGSQFLNSLKQLQMKHPLISDVRGLGLLTALVLRRPDGSPATAEAEQVMYSALRKGLSFKTTMGSTIMLTPPLTIEEEHLSASIEILDQCFRELERA